MNYAEARERKDENGNPSGLFDWTVMNDGIIHRAHPCTDECVHTTKDDATRHFYEWSLAQVKEYFDEVMQHKCEVCGKWTQTQLGAFGFSSYPFGPTYLCDEHRNLDELKKIFPFRGTISMIYS